MGEAPWSRASPQGSWCGVPGGWASGRGLTRGTLSPQAFPDNAARREVESLPAVCSSEGCTWKGTLKEYEVGAALRWLKPLPQSSFKPA